jgi:hypothetical protein
MPQARTKRTSGVNRIHRRHSWIQALRSTGPRIGLLRKKCIFPERRPNLAQYQNNVGSGNYLLQKNAEVPVEKRSTENGEHF